MKFKELKEKMGKGQGHGEGLGEGEGQGSGGRHKCQLIALLLALFFPPGEIILIDGCHCNLLINIVLTLLCWVPGMIHAFYVVLQSQ